MERMIWKQAAVHDDCCVEYERRLYSVPWRLIGQKVWIKATPSAIVMQHDGICERFHKTVLNEFYRVAFRKKLYASIAELQEDLDAWLREYHEERPHQGRWCYGKTPMQTFIDTIPLAKEKLIASAAA